MAYSTMSGDKAPTLNSIPVVANPLSVVTEEEIRDLDSPVNNKHVSGKKKGSMYLIEMNDGSLQLGIASGSRAGDKWFIDDETDSIFAVEFKVTAGLFDFSLAGATNIRWYFPEDGTISTASRPAKTLTEAQTVVLSAKWGDEAELKSNGTYGNYVGDLSDLSNVSYYLRLYNCSNVTGDLSDVSNVSSYLSLYNCSNITGDLSDVSNVSYYLNLYGCSNITGDLSDISNVSYLLSLYNCSNIIGDLSDVSNVSYYLRLFNCSSVTGDLSDVSNVSHFLDLYDCSNVTGDLSDVSNVSYYLRLFNCSNVTGSLSSACTATDINLTNIDCSSAELDTTIANLVTANQSDGTLILTGLTRTSASSADVATLESRGWTVTDATIV
jgi:hypothetical protein